MPIATIQSQIQQLQAQIKLSKSPKQTKMLEGAIARLEKKLKEEAAEQARLKSEAEAKAKAEKEAKAAKEAREAEAKEARRKLEAEAQEKVAREVKKAIVKQVLVQGEPQKNKNRGPFPPKKKQKVSRGKILEAVPGQGHHVFCWKIFAEIRIDDQENYQLYLEDVDEPILISQLSKKAYTALKNLELPAKRFCLLYPLIKDGKIASTKVQLCVDSKQKPELFFAKGYWIAEDKTLQIQTDFRFHGMRSQNIFHQIPVREGITPPQTGFRSLQLERDRLNVYVVGEVDSEGTE